LVTNRLQKLKMRMHVLKAEYSTCDYNEFEKQRSILKESTKLNRDPEGIN